MTEEKRNRIVAALTVNAIILIFIIIAVIISQIVEISVLQRRKNELIQEYQQLEQELENKEEWEQHIIAQDEYYEWLMAYIDFITVNNLGDYLGVLGNIYG